MELQENVGMKHALESTIEFMERNGPLRDYVLIAPYLSKKKSIDYLRPIADTVPFTIPIAFEIFSYPIHRISGARLKYITRYAFCD